MELPKRKQHRLQGFDYSTPANYFITIVTEGRDNLFGSIVDENICLYEAGRMVLNTYKTLVENYECGLEPIIVVMPNHIHFVLRKCCEDTNIQTFIQKFKRLTTNKYIEGVNKNGWKHFGKRLWQRTYYDHIIRSNQAYDFIVNYIHENPKRWSYDAINLNCCNTPDNIMAKVIEFDNIYNISTNIQTGGYADPPLQQHNK